MPRTPVLIPDLHALDWTPLPASEGNVPGPVAKALTYDPLTGAETVVVHIPPGWHDEALDWHPCIEEVFKLSGVVGHPGKSYRRGAYIYRPPGLLHGPSFADPLVGTTGISRFDQALRIVREAERALGDDGEPVSEEYAASPAGYLEHRRIGSLKWQPTTAGPWAGTRHKWLNHYATGGGAVLIEIPRGWVGEGSRARGTLEEFVFTGTVVADGVHFTPWGYACRAAGQPAGSYSSDGGGQIMCWWEQDELAG
jgi:hypothetical protein